MGVWSSRPCVVVSYGWFHHMRFHTGNEFAHTTWDYIVKNGAFWKWPKNVLIQFGWSRGGYSLGGVIVANRGGEFKQNSSKKCYFFGTFRQKWQPSFKWCCFSKSSSNLEIDSYPWCFSGVNRKRVMLHWSFINLAKNRVFSLPIWTVPFFRQDSRTTCVRWLQKFRLMPSLCTFLQEFLQRRRKWS